jgi:uncharacterized protein (TIGR00369 family)
VSEPIDPDELLARMRANHGAFMNILGGRLEAADQARGWARLHWHPSEDCCHSGDVVQGGFVTSMLDATMAHALVARSGLTMTVPTLELKVSFLQVCHPVPHVTEGTVIRWGRSIGFAEADLWDAEGTLIARASSTCRLTPVRR